MAQLKLLDIRDYLASILPGDDSLVKSGFIDRNNKMSIGVFPAPESRNGNTMTYGGKDLAPVSKYPVNVLVRWTEDSDICEERALEIYRVFEEAGTNFFIRANDPSSAQIAFFSLLDSQPVSLGRDKENVCEYSIRIDIFYYH